MSHSRRQLAAIMFTDIEGYTALMQQDEEKALQARGKHRQLFHSITEKHRGRILQYYGDGTLSIFDSALDAVQCGIELQLGWQTTPVIPVRIGIHTGDVFFSEEDIVGDSVNVAARIESLAVPGSVFISEKVYDEIKNQGSIQAYRLKAFKLKNVEKPVVVYAIANEGLIVPDPDEIAGKTEPLPSPGSEPPKEPGSAIRPGGAPFLATKLFIPPHRPNAVLRPRLLERLNVGLPGKLTLISAPAGFGKTTLVSEWAAGCDRPVAWLSLDEQDGDPTRFMTYLSAALQTIAPHVGEGVLRGLQAGQAPPMEWLLTTLLNEITTIQQPFVLVLDDYHVLDSPPVDAAITFLIEHLPPQMHLIITTREDPQVPLPRLRVRGQLNELRAADLRFTPPEAAGFLNQAMGLHLTGEEIAALETRTEGWIAGLQMAALSMQGRTDRAGFIQAFTGSHRFVLDYLAEEVLLRQPERVRNFLLQTAILHRLCGDLCDAVTGQEDSREMLEALERGNLFVVSLDDRRQWYRYHHLFADVLRARAMEELPQLEPLLHRRASEWYERHDAPADAIRHALTAGDFERAAGLIELVWPAMDGAFQTTTWLSWAKALPEEVVQTRPALLAGYAWAFLNDGHLEAGEARLREAEQWLTTPAGQPSPAAAAAEMIVVDQEQFRVLPASIAVARAYLAQAYGDGSGTVHYARQALDLATTDDHIHRGQATALLGLAYWRNGDLETAHQALTDTMAHFRTAGNIQFAISVTYGLADIRNTQGRLRDAIKTYEQSLHLVAGQGLPAPQGTADLYLGLGDLHRERGHLEPATQYLLKSEELGLPAALPDWPYRLCIAKARLKEAQGSPNDALDLLNQAERLYFRTPMPEVRPLAALKARLWARQGRLEEALTWIHECGLSVDDNLSYLHEFGHLTLAAVHIAGYRAGLPGCSIERAARLLERLLKAAEAGGRVGSMIEILGQQALAWAILDNPASALASLEQALALAEPEGYVRIFADEGLPMAQLLSEAAARGISPGYMARLRAAFPDNQATDRSSSSSFVTAAQPLIEPLSRRELEILQYIARGLSNQEISERLFLALSTVKGHNQNIFGKLGVQRRTEAIARARELGLL